MKHKSSYIFRDALGDVHLDPETRHTEVGRVGVYRSAALTTQDLASHRHQISGGDGLHPQQPL